MHFFLIKHAPYTVYMCSITHPLHICAPIPSSKKKLSRHNPKLSVSLKESTLQLHVLAADGCLPWMIPFGLASFNKLTNYLLPNLIAWEHVVMVWGDKDNTLSNYGAGILSFATYLTCLKTFTCWQ